MYALFVPFSRTPRPVRQQLKVDSREGDRTYSHLQKRPEQKRSPSLRGIPKEPFEVALDRFWGKKKLSFESGKANRTAQPTTREKRGTHTPTTFAAVVDFFGSQTREGTVLGLNDISAGARAVLATTDADFSLRR